jgi:K+-sensing histidine kinase KdpD
MGRQEWEIDWGSTLIEAERGWDRVFLKGRPGNGKTFEMLI